MLTISANPTGSQCGFSQESLEKNLLSCVSHDFKLMMQIMENLKNPKAMMSPDFICNNQKDLADVADCMVKKYASCLPNAEVIFDVLPSKQKWLEGLKFTCDNRKDLIENTCMQSSSQQFMQCYVEKLQSLDQLVAGGFTRENLEKAICSIVNFEVSCIQSNHGTCSKQVVDLMMQSLGKFLPLDRCPMDLLNQPQNAFSNILIHGQPIQFQPEGGIASDESDQLLITSIVPLIAVLGRKVDEDLK
ncbi:hypothetical protein Btru_047113 [Bulinus truncatus]|nr:hypothetical protein Btru_047113 [Bulinus truncatus]